MHIGWGEGAIYYPIEGFRVDIVLGRLDCHGMCIGFETRHKSLLCTSSLPVQTKNSGLKKWKRADAISHLALIDPALVLLLPASLHSLPMLIL